MADDRTKHMTGLFRDREAAERGYACLINRGYTSGDASLLLSDETRKRYFPRAEEPKTELGTKAAKGAGLGAVAGGGLGALLAGMAADSEVGWYGAASSLAGLSLLLAPLIGWVLMPLLARARARSREELDELVRRSIEATLVHDLIRARAGCARIDGKFQVLADGLRFELPCQRTAGKQADGKESDHTGRKSVVTA